MLFTLHIYQYRMEKSGKGGSQYHYITLTNSLIEKLHVKLISNACEDYYSAQLHPTSGLIIRLLRLLSIKDFVIYYFNSAIAINVILSDHWSLLVLHLVQLPICLQCDSSHPSGDLTYET